jgi:hypothetical protein
MDPITLISMVAGMALGSILFRMFREDAIRKDLVREVARKIEDADLRCKAAGDLLDRMNKAMIGYDSYVRDTTYLVNQLKDCAHETRKLEAGGLYAQYSTCAISGWLPTRTTYEGFRKDFTSIQ